MVKIPVEAFVAANQNYRTRVEKGVIGRTKLGVAMLLVGITSIRDKNP